MRQHLLDQISAVARREPRFAEALLRDPRAAIAERFGVPVPDAWTIEAGRDDAGAVRLGLGDGPLPDDFLDAATGGTSGGAWSDLVAAVSAVSSAH